MSVELCINMNSILNNDMVNKGEYLGFGICEAIILFATVGSPLGEGKPVDGKQCTASSVGTTAYDDTDVGCGDNPAWPWWVRYCVDCSKLHASYRTTCVCSELGASSPGTKSYRWVVTGNSTIHDCQKAHATPTTPPYSGGPINVPLPL